MYILLNDAVSISEHIESNVLALLANNESESIWEAVVVAWFKVLFQDSMSPEDNHEKSQDSRYPGWHSNRLPLECDAEAISLEPTFLVATEQYLFAYIY